MGQSAAIEPRIAEFDWLKVLALFLLMFVHSDLLFVFPDVVTPLMWFMISCFFFVSGFLALNSFHKRGASIKRFFKTKILLLYIPFLFASLVYFALQTALAGENVDLLHLLSNVTLLNIFNSLNTIYNWGFLWFIPYLLVFMLIFCFLEKYVKNIKLQVSIVLFLWFFTILAWVYDATLKPGQLFSQYFLVFMIGVWLNKLKLYKKAISVKTALVAVPLLALFTLDFSYLFTFSNTTNALESLLYTNGRSIILSLSAVLLALFFFQKFRFPRNRFIELVAMASIFVYLLDPIFAFALSNYVFGQPSMPFAAGSEFYICMTVRILLSLVLLPFVVTAIRAYVRKSRGSIKPKKTVNDNTLGEPA